MYRILKDFFWCISKLFSGAFPNFSSGTFSYFFSGAFPNFFLARFQTWWGGLVLLGLVALLAFFAFAIPVVATLG